MSWRNTILVSCIVTAFLAVFMRMDADFCLFFSTEAANNSFVDKVVWVTGASSGIGSSIALNLCNRDARVIMSARRYQNMKHVAKMCKGKHEPDIFPFDFSDHRAQRDAYSLLIEKYGYIDIVILNPAKTQRALAVEFDLESTRDLMELNFFSYVNLARLTLPKMIQQKSGQHGYFDAVRAEVAAHNVSISIVCPGPVVSEIVSNAVRIEGDHVAEEQDRMDTQRCTDLILKGMHHRLSEIWVSHQPYLLHAYLARLFPPLTRFMTAKAAVKRILSLKQGAPATYF